MIKIATFIALGFAAASATFLAEDRFLQGATGVAQTTCTAPAGGADSCKAAGYCCASLTRTAVTGAAPAAVQLCVPFNVAGQTYNNVSASGTNVTVGSCLIAPTTVPAACASNITVCGNASTNCCATVTTTLGGVAPATATAASQCIV